MFEKMINDNIRFYINDIDEDIATSNFLAIDTETMGLKTHRDRLCVVQLCFGDGIAHIVQFPQQKYDCPNLKKLLADSKIQKIFHFARFDLAVLYNYLDIMIDSIYCTKIASHIVRSFSNRHGLKSLCSELLGVEISKQNQSSDWGNPNLTKEQLLYAASDVLHLHKLKDKLQEMLIRENREQLTKQCFDCLPTIVQLDLLHYNESVFSHIMN